MTRERLCKLTESLHGISYPEWVQIKIIIDSSFEGKKREAEHDLRLPAFEELAQINRSRFE